MKKVQLFLFAALVVWASQTYYRGAKPKADFSFSPQVSKVPVVRNAKRVEPNLLPPSVSAENVENLTSDTAPATEDTVVAEPSPILSEQSTARSSQVESAAESIYAEAKSPLALSGTNEVLVSKSNAESIEPTAVTNSKIVEPLPLEVSSAIAENVKSLAPARAPATEDTVVVQPSPALDEQDAIRFSQVEVGAESYYTRLDTRDTLNGTSGILLSKLNYSLDLSWVQNWMPNLKSVIRTKIRSEEYLSDSSRPVTAFVERKKVLFSFDFGMRSQREKFYHSEEIHFSQELYEKGLQDLSGIELVTAVVPKVFLNAGYTLLNLKPYVVYVEAGAIILGPGQGVGFSPKWGLGGVVKAGLLQNLSGDNSLRAEVFYSNQRLGSSISSATRQDFGLSIHFTRRF